MRLFRSAAEVFSIKNASLKTQMALKVSLLFAVAAAVIASVALSYMEREFKRSISEQQYAMARSIADNLDDKILLAQKALVAAGAQVTTAMLADTERAQRFLDDLRPLQSMFTNKLLLFDAYGNRIAESPFEPNFTSLNIGFRDHYKKTVSSRKPVISAPFESTLADRQPLLALTVPLFDNKGNMVGILVGSLKLLGANFLGDLPTMKIGKTGYFYLATKDGIIISHPDRSRIMKLAALPGTNRLFDKAMAGFEGCDITVNTYGTSMLTSFRNMHSTGWIIGLNFPTDEAYAAVIKTRRSLALGVAGGALAVLVFVWLLTKRLTLPLLNVTRQVKSMEAGVGLVPLDVADSSYEIVTMSAAFNRLIETVQKQQRDLQEIGRKYRFIADNTHEWEFWLSPELHFIYSSPSGKRITGVDSEAFLADPESLNRIIHPEDREMYQSCLLRAAQTARLQEIECRIIRSDGTVRWMAHLCKPVYDEGGAYMGLRGTNVDITKRREMEHDLLQHQEKLRVANDLLEQRVRERTADLELAIREQESFSYSVSHDLRAPLRHINSFSAILIEEFGEGLSSEARSYLDKICAASSRMGALIDYLLELSRMSRTELQLEPIDLSELAEDVLDMLRETDPQRCVEVCVTDSITVLGDLTLFRLLMENLLGNAWKYTSNKPLARIEFGMTRVAEDEVFFVRDNGVGFDMAYQQRLFGVFERLHGSEFEGVGVGLATSQRIIKRHGGKIWAEGSVGEGATFYFTVPVYF